MLFFVSINALQLDISTIKVCLYFVNHTLKFLDINSSKNDDFFMDNGRAGGLGGLVVVEEFQERIPP